MNRRWARTVTLAVVMALGSLMLPTGAQQKPRVAFIPQIVGIPYFNAMEAGGTDAAARFGVRFIYQGPTTTSPTDQLRIFDSLVQQKVEAISISVLDPTSINPAIAQARKAGLHVFTSDSDAPSSEREAYVAQALDQDLGYAIIDGMASRIGGQGEIGVVSGEPTANNLNTWIKFMKERVAQKYPRIKIATIRYAGGEASKAFQLATEEMTAFPAIKGLIAVASTTCPGVGQAIEKAHKIGKVVGTGYCSPNTARSFIKSGAMPFTVLWDPIQLGYLTVWAGAQLIRGQAFHEENTVPGMSHPVRYFADTRTLLLGPPTVFTKANVDRYNF
jgi:ABC-type sugar transport system substrate-binding protein